MPRAAFSRIFPYGEGVRIGNTHLFGSHFLIPCLFLFPSALSLLFILFTTLPDFLSLCLLLCLHLAVYSLVSSRLASCFFPLYLLRYTRTYPYPLPPSQLGPHLFPSRCIILVWASSLLFWFCSSLSFLSLILIFSHVCSSMDMKGSLPPLLRPLHQNSSMCLLLN